MSQGAPRYCNRPHKEFQDQPTAFVWPACSSSAREGTGFASLLVFSTWRNRLHIPNQWFNTFGSPTAPSSSSSYYHTYAVTKNRVWIGNWIYWILTQNCTQLVTTLYRSLLHASLVSSVKILTSLMVTASNGRRTESTGNTASDRSSFAACVRCMAMTFVVLNICNWLLSLCFAVSAQQWVYKVQYTHPFHPGKNLVLTFARTLDLRTEF
jgi:hypothetical protein